MREVVRADLGLGRNPLVTPTLEWGLNHPKEYTFFTWRIWRMSNFQAYPNGLAYDQQPQALMDDFFELERVYAYQRHYLKDEKKD